MKIGLIGGGAMGGAIVSSLLRDKVATAEEIRVADLAVDRLRYMHETFGIQASSDNRVTVEGADFVVLALKPQDFAKAAKDIHGELGESTTAVSIMAGVDIASIAGLMGTNRVVRSMPNTPAMIGEGMTVWTSTPAVDDDAKAGVRKIFGSMGKEAYVPEEKYLDMATGLSGSGPAYVFLFLEALTDAGVHIGLSRDLAATMALQTVLGSARYAESTGKHPAELRNQVTSAGGTTAEALRAFEAGSFRSVVLEAVIAAFKKSKALGEESKK
jgi:pyrroline-5-carboxylate reductase